MRLILIFLVFVQVCPRLGLAQVKLTDSLENYVYGIINSDSLRAGCFNDLKEAYTKKDSVYRLDLRGYGLSEFPEIVFEFENLVYLRLDYDNVIINPGTKLDAFENRFKDGGYMVSYRRSNFIKKIPCEIGDMKSLKILDIRGLPLSKREVKKLWKCFKGDFIFTDYNY